MDTHEYKLNGLNDEDLLPPIYPNTENDYIRVNSTASAYELTSPDSGLVPVPQASKLLLNSSGVGTYLWTDQAEVPKLTLDAGAIAGLNYTNGCNIIGEITDLKIRNGTTERIVCTASGVDLKGPVTTDGLITIPSSITDGIVGSGTSNRVLIGPNDIRLSIGGTSRISATANGMSLTGSITQNNAVNTNTIFGNTTFSNGTLTISQPCIVSSTNTITLVSGNLTCTNGQVNGNNIKTSNGGTNVLCAVRVVENNCGLYQSSTGNLDIVGGGVVGLNMNSTRTQTQNIFSFSRGPAFAPNIYTFAQAHTIFSSTPPQLICKTPASGSIDLEFNAASSYFGGQQFTITVLDTGAGTARYIAQSTTIHITGGAAAVTIASNTYHTLVKDRYHILYCNVDSEQFYLIQT